MDQSTLSTLFIIIGALAASSFVIGLHFMNSPATARNGNLISAGGMAVAIVVTFIYLVLRDCPHETCAVGGLSTEALIIIIAGFAIGAAAGMFLALRVAMTAMPPVSWPTTLSFQARSGSTWISGSPNTTPCWDRCAASSITADACSRAFDGMQPTFRQTPPSTG